MAVASSRAVGHGFARLFLLAVLVAGSFALWTAVPGVVLWALSQLIEEKIPLLLAAMGSVPLAIGLFAMILIQIDRLYVRVAIHGGGELPRLEDPSQPPKGPLEAIVVVSIVIAIAALLVWMLFFAENQFPYTQPIPA